MRVNERTHLLNGYLAAEKPLPPESLPQLCKAGEELHLQTPVVNSL